MRRAKTNKILLGKLLNEENYDHNIKQQSSESIEGSSQSDSLIPKVSKKSNALNVNDVKTQKLAKILGTDMSQAAIVKKAIEAAKKPARKFLKPTVQDLEEDAAKHTPKRVKFQMSKTQV